MSRVITCAAGPYAVVIPADTERPVRVIDRPGTDPATGDPAIDMDTLYREIEATHVGMRSAGAGLFAFWIDTEIDERTDARTGGALTGTEADRDARWVANSRAFWLATALKAPLALMAGTVVVTLVAPDQNDDIQGLSRETADALADIARDTPRHDVAALTRLLRQARDRGPVWISFTETAPREFLI